MSMLKVYFGSGVRFFVFACRPWGHIGVTNPFYKCPSTHRGYKPLPQAPFAPQFEKNRENLVWTPTVRGCPSRWKVGRMEEEIDGLEQYVDFDEFFFRAEARNPIK